MGDSSGVGKKNSYHVKGCQNIVVCGLIDCRFYLKCSFNFFPKFSKKIPEFFLKKNRNKK